MLFTLFIIKLFLVVCPISLDNEIARWKSECLHLIARQRQEWLTAESTQWTYVKGKLSHTQLEHLSNLTSRLVRSLWERPERGERGIEATARALGMEWTTGEARTQRGLGGKDRTWGGEGVGVKWWGLGGRRQESRLIKDNFMSTPKLPAGRITCPVGSFVYLKQATLPGKSLIIAVT